MTTNQTDIPRPSAHALVLGNGITVLGTIRALGRAGIPVVCAETVGGIESTSRYYRKAPLTIDAGADEKALSQYLKSLPYERCVVFPCTDHWSMSFAKVRDQMSTEDLQRFPWYGPSAEVLNTFTDKDAFRAALLRHSTPAPLSIEVNPNAPADALLGIPPGSTFFIKPTDSQRFHRDFNCKAFRFSTVEEAREKLLSVYARGHAALLQELIPGSEDSHYYVEGILGQNGELVSLFARQRLRMYPDEFGNSTAMVSVSREVTARAEESLLRLLRGERFKGIFSAEFKRDSRDGEFKIIEVNVRPWWYVQFACECGINIPATAFAVALGTAAESRAEYRIGISSVNAYTDIQVWKRIIRQGRAGWFAPVKAWWGGYFTVFDAKDPLPGILWLVGRVRDLLRKAFNGR